MSRDIKVSVLTPIYNHKIEYVRECLESLRAQTMQDIEFILIDNGATDESKALISEFEQSDSRFRVIHLKENQGYGGAMNAGLDAAKGDYIGIVESDDWVEPEMFEKLYGIATDTNSDIVKCLFKSHYRDKTNILVRFDNQLYNRILNPDDVPDYINKYCSFWTAIYKKQLLIENNIKFDILPQPSAEDLMFTIKTYICSKKLYIIPDELYNYRSDNPNSSIRKRGIQIYNTFKLFDKLSEFIENNEKLNLPRNWYLKNYREFLSAYWTYTDKNIKIQNELFFVLLISKKFRKNLKNNRVKLNDKELRIYEKIAYHPILFYLTPKFKSLLQTIFSVKNNDRKSHKKITILGLKFNVKRTENFEQKLRSILREEVSQIVAREVSQALCVQKLHMQTFPQFKNIHNNQSIAIIGCGPSVKYYDGKLDTVNIALNKAIFLENINFNYLFTWDYQGFLKNVPEFFDEVKIYNCKKFYGRFLSDRMLSLPEFADDAINNVYHFYSSARHMLPAYSYGEIIHYDIETHPLADFMSISFGALHFALYTRPKKIYLIGLDTQNCGHYAGDNNTYNINKMMLGYKKFKAHIQAHYPDVEIISVNPVGLKGMFRDVYTESYLEANPELKNKIQNIELLSQKMEDACK